MIIDRPSSSLRWPILILACFMFLGSYYSFDIPSSLKKKLEDYLSNSNTYGMLYETNFSLLYTLYAIPNVILPLFGGFLVDYFGIRSSLLCFTLIITFGQLLFTIGIIYKSWPLLFFGRFVFGMGGESLNVSLIVNCPKYIVYNIYTL